MNALNITPTLSQEKKECKCNDFTNTIADKSVRKKLAIYECALRQYIAPLQLYLHMQEVKNHKNTLKHGKIKKISQRKMKRWKKRLFRKTKDYQLLFETPFPETEGYSFPKLKELRENFMTSFLYLKQEENTSCFLTCVQNCVEEGSTFLSAFNGYLKPWHKFIPLLTIFRHSFGKINVLVPLLMFCILAAILLLTGCIHLIF